MLTGADTQATDSEVRSRLVPAAMVSDNTASTSLGGGKGGEGGGVG